MSTTLWSPTGEVAVEAMVGARLQAHFAVQLIAGFGRDQLQALDDDSHTSLTWSGEHAALLGQASPDGIRVGLRIYDLTLLVLGAAATTEYALDDCSLAQAAAWLATQTGADDEVIMAIAYQLPGHALAIGGRFDTSRHKRALAALSAWFELADTHIAAIVKPIGDAIVRCWPHHFDIAALIEYSDPDDEQAVSVGCGLSPGDQHYAYPYWYVSPWPYPSSDALPTLPSGHWHTNGFTAAVLESTALTQANDPIASSRAFLTAALSGSAAAIGV
ncbi:MAG: hypothetical protein AAGA84_00630 [Pseudomonadota bacterium]